MELRVLDEETGSGTTMLRGDYKGESNSVVLNIEYSNGTTPEPLMVEGRNLCPKPKDELIVNVFLPREGNQPEDLINGLKDLVKIRDYLKRNGYEGKHQSEDEIVSEYVYRIPFRDKTHLDSILQAFRQVDIPSSSSSQQLEELFAGKLDKRTLEGLVTNVDAELKRVTINTGSIGVVSFNSDGKKGYGKVSSSKPALLNEEKALKELQQDKIARVLAPIPIGLVIGEQAGALFTWGTENKNLYDPEDVAQYTSLFNTLLFQYAQEKKHDLVRLAKDPIIRDVFNRAIINTALRNYVSLNPSPDVYEIELLEERASRPDPNSLLFSSFRDNNSTYLDAKKRTKTLNPGNSVFLHGDARPENIGKDRNGIRPLVDWSNAKMGSFAEDLSALETKDNPKYLDWYKFVTGFRGYNFVAEDSKELLLCHDVLQPYRTGSFKLSKGRFNHAAGDALRLNRNVKRYKEFFRL